MSVDKFISFDYSPHLKVQYMIILSDMNPCTHGWKFKLQVKGHTQTITVNIFTACKANTVTSGFNRLVDTPKHKEVYMVNNAVEVSYC